MGDAYLCPHSCHLHKNQISSAQTGNQLNLLTSYDFVWQPIFKQIIKYSTCITDHHIKYTTIFFGTKFTSDWDEIH